MNRPTEIDFSIVLESIKKHQLEPVVFFLSENTSWSTYIVGGTIRDALLGLSSRNLDLDLMIKPASKALEATKQIANICGNHYFVLDEERYIYRIQGDHYQIDVNGIRAEDVIGDMFNRDFSVNAICVACPEIAKALHNNYTMLPCWDFFFGREDLANRVIRAQNPNAFTEDPLRILRGFRFMVNLKGSIEETTLEYMIRDRNLLKKISGERIRDEFVKILQEPHSCSVLSLMDQKQVLAVFFPFLNFFKEIDEKYTQKLQVKTHTLETLLYLEALFLRIDTGQFPFAEEINSLLVKEISADRSVRVLLKIAALLHDIGKPCTLSMEGDRLRFFDHEQKGSMIAKEWLCGMRFSNQEQDFISFLIENHMRPHNLSNADLITDKARYRFFRECKEESFPLLLMALADAYATKRVAMGDLIPYESFVKDMIQFSQNPAKVKPVPLVNGTEIMALLEIKPSKTVGNILEELLELQSLGSIKNREEAFLFVKTKKTNNFV